MSSILHCKTDSNCGDHKNTDSIFLLYLKLFEENLGESLPEVGRAEDGLDNDHSSVARVHQQVPDWSKWQKQASVMV